MWISPKPAQISSPNLSMLLTKLDLDVLPTVIKVSPAKGATQDNCFPNVKRIVDDLGGEIIYGWSVYENPFLIEAEFHAVWKDPEANVVDIAPRPDEHILFIKDNNRVYENKQVNSVRINTSSNGLVDDFIALFDARFLLINKGSLENIIGRINLSGRDAEKYEAIQTYIVGIQGLLGSGGTRNSRCFCGDGSKFKHCHGKDLIAILKKF